MTWIEIISAILGLACVVLAGRNRNSNFWVGYVYNAFLLFLCFKSRLYSNVILCVVSIVINVFGHYRWTHPREDEKSASDGSRLKVSGLSGRQWAAFLLIALAAGAAWALYLAGHTDDASPWLGAYVMMATFLAQYLSARKCWECWLVWLAVNVANIALYCTAGRYVMAATYGLYFINGLVSLVNWKRKFANNE